MTNYREILRLHRESCYQCVYVNTSRVGDLTVGTEKGQKLFEMMRVLAEVEEATLEEGVVKQHNLV